MSIDETLKENLLTDIEQSLDITLTDNDKTFLGRCFEITIGHHYTNQPSPAMSPKPQEVITDTEIMVYFNNHFDRRIIGRADIPVMTRSAVIEMFHHFRSQMTVNRREELIKFYESLGEDNHYFSKSIVDEYLTSLNQKEK